MEFFCRWEIVLSSRRVWVSLGASPHHWLSIWPWENSMLWSGFSLCKEGMTMPCYLTRVLCEFAERQKAPWKWRGLHKSLVLFTQQTFSPENKVVNGTIVQLVERVQKFPFTTSRSSCGWLYGLSVLTPNSFQNSSTMDSPGMKSRTVRDAESRRHIT